MIQTGYGKMAIEEYEPGKVRMVQGGVVETRRKRMGYQAATAHADTGLPPRKRLAGVLPVGSMPVIGGAGSNPAPAPREQYDSKLEAARATYWGYLLLAGDIQRVIHHPFSTDLAVELRYTPDFMIWWADGRIQVEEVKGNLKQKNARDSISRLKMAAAKFPMFEWRLTMRIRGQWEEKCILTSK